MRFCQDLRHSCCLADSQNKTAFVSARLSDSLPCEQLLCEKTTAAGSSPIPTHKLLYIVTQIDYPHSRWKKILRIFGCPHKICNSTGKNPGSDTKLTT